LDSDIIAKLVHRKNDFAEGFKILQIWK